MKNWLARSWRNFSRKVYEITPLSSLFILSERNGQTARRHEIRFDSSLDPFDIFDSNLFPILFHVRTEIVRESNILVNLILTRCNTMNNTEGEEKTNLKKRGRKLIQCNFRWLTKPVPRSSNSPYFTGKCPTSSGLRVTNDTTVPRNRKSTKIEVAAIRAAYDSRG